MYKECFSSTVAEETLRERGSQLGGKAIYHLTWLATGDRDVAEDAYVAHVEAVLRAGGTPESLG